MVLARVSSASWLLVLLLHLSRSRAYPEGSPRGPDYCDKSNKINECGENAVNNDKHLFCKCEDTTEYPYTLYEPKYNNLTEYREFNLHWHNYYRNRIAFGEERELKTTLNEYLPAGSNLIALKYNYQLEDSARCHVKRGVFAHENCHSTEKYPKYGGGGQNIAWQKLNKNRKPTCTDTKKQPIPLCDENTMSPHFIFAHVSIYAWYKEIIYMLQMSKYLDKYDLTGHTHENEIGHLTQLIWATTEEVGCSAATNGPQFWSEFLYTCHYWPMGNIWYKKTYLKGPAATQCPASHPANMDDKYKGLCGKAEIPPAPRPTFFISLVGLVDPEDLIDNSPALFPQATLLTLIVCLALLVQVIFK